MRFVTLLVFALLISLPSAAQISFTGEYYQDFEELGADVQAALPDGWRADAFPTAREPGAYADGQATTDIRGGALFARGRAGIVNFGSGPEDTASERALGVALRLGEVQTGVLYAHFRNDTGEAIDRLLLANYRESYRGGEATTIFRDLFFSSDGVAWTAFGGSGASTQYGFPDGFNFPPGPVGAANPTDLPETVPAGGEWFFAFRYYATATSGEAPAMALDQFGIATSAEAAGVVFLNRGGAEFGPVFIGSSEFGGASFDVVPSSAPAGAAEVTGPNAADFVVTEVEAASIGTRQSVYFEFRPTGPGWREAELRLFAADTMSRAFTLRGFGVVNPEDDDSEDGDGTATSEEEGASSLALALSASPNPSAGPVRLRVTIPEATPVRLSVYDALGREVALVLDRQLPAGSHDAAFDASGLVPGVYFARLTTPGGRVTSVLSVSR